MRRSERAIVALRWGCRLLNSPPFWRSGGGQSLVVPARSTRSGWPSASPACRSRRCGKHWRRRGIGNSMEHEAYTWLSGFAVYEPVATGVLVALLLIGFAVLVRARIGDPHQALEPEDGLTVRNVGEIAVEGMNSIAESVI